MQPVPIVEPLLEVTGVRVSGVCTHKVPPWNGVAARCIPWIRTPRRSKNAEASERRRFSSLSRASRAEVECSTPLREVHRMCLRPATLLIVSLVASSSTAALPQDPATVFPHPLLALHGLPTVGLELADLDRDGRLDLVSLSSIPYVIDVARGAPLGGFEPPKARAFQVQPRGMALAEVDGDAFLDAVVAHHDTGASYFTLLRGTGNASFTPPSYHHVPFGPNSVAAGDIDRDGDIDLLLGDEKTASVRAWWIAGANDGTFSTPQPLDMGPTPREVKLADIDGDGWLDALALTGTSFDVKLTVRRGTGIAAGPFAPAQHTLVHWNSLSLLVADFDEDGSLDAAVVDPYFPTGQSTVVLLRGQGDGQFASMASLEIGVRAWLVLHADLDGDGRRDLVTCNVGDEWSISFLRANGVGSFGPERRFSALGRLAWIAAGDLNGDGRADIVLSMEGGYPDHRGDAVTLFAEPDGSVAAYPTFDFGLHFRRGACGDFNGDGWGDIAAIARPLTSSATETFVLHGGPNGGFAIAQELGDASDSPLDLRLADVDADQRDDLILLREGSAEPRRSIEVHHGRAKGTFEHSFDLVGGQHTFGLAIGDLDGDGSSDVVNALRQNYLVANRGDGVGGFQHPTRIGLPEPALSLQLADFNHDGRDDVVAVTWNDWDLRYLVRVSSSGGGFDEPVRLDYLDELRWVHPADIDGDGQVDLLVCGRTWPLHDRIGFLPGLGDGTFGSARDLGIAESVQLLGVADFDADGAIDIALSGNVLILLRGLGGGAFDRPERTMGPAFSLALGVLDVDRDGRLDLVMAGPRTCAILRSR